MGLKIITADERLAAANVKTTMAVFGPSGSGKTSLLKTLPPEETLCIDLEAGMKSVQDWRGDSIPVRTFKDALDVACLVGGIDPAADDKSLFCADHYQHVAETYPDLVRLIASKRIVFVDSITDLTRQAMAWAKTPARGDLRKDRKARHPRRLRPARARDDRAAQAPAARARQDRDLRRHPGKGHRRVQSRHLAAADGRRQGRARTARHRRRGDHAQPVHADGDSLRHDPERGQVRRLVCQSGNPFGLPAKDRSGRLDVTEPPDLGALLRKINIGSSSKG